MCRIRLIALIALLLTAPAVADGWTVYTPLDGETYGMLKQVPIPSGYKDCFWTWFLDYAAIRSYYLGLMTVEKKALEYSFDAGIGKLVTGGIEYKLGSEVAKWVGVTLFGEFLNNVATETLGISAIDEFLPSKWNPATYVKQFERLSTELGISDHFIFGRACCSSRWTVLHDVPLGARVFVWIMPDSYFLGQKDYSLICLNDRVVNIPTLLGTKIQESKPGALTGETSYTVQVVFGYEMYNGQRIPPHGKPLYKLPVQEFGKVGGQIILEPRPDVGLGGIREIHISSPINKGVLSRQEDLDSFVFALILNKDTVEVYGPDSPIEIERQADSYLDFNVRIKGFHTGAKTVKASDGSEYKWEDLANRVFKGAVCEQGSVHLDMQIHHHPSMTTVRCAPMADGPLRLVLQTMQGPVVLTEVTVRMSDRSTDKKEEEYVIWANRLGEYDACIVEIATKTHYENNYKNASFSRTLSGFVTDGNSLKDRLKAMWAANRVKSWFKQCEMRVGNEICIAHTDCFDEEVKILSTGSGSATKFEPATQLEGTNTLEPATGLEPATKLEPATTLQKESAKIPSETKSAWQGAVEPPPTPSPKPPLGSWSKAIDKDEQLTVKRQASPPPPVKKEPAARTLPQPQQPKSDGDSLLGVHWSPSDDKQAAKTTRTDTPSLQAPRSEDEVRQALENMGFKIVEKTTFGDLSGYYIEITDAVKAAQFGFKELKKARAGYGITGNIACWTEQKGNQLIIWIDWRDVEIRDDSKLPPYVKLYAK